MWQKWCNNLLKIALGHLMLNIDFGNNKIPLFNVVLTNDQYVWYGIYSSLLMLSHKYK